MQVTDSKGKAVASRKVSRGDRICILGVYYARQLAEIVYPTKFGYMHGYIHNVPSQYRSRYYNDWRNGKTRERIYNAAGREIDCFRPHVAATLLYKSNKGYTVLYSTAKGGETKTGLVRYGGVR